MSFMLYGCSSFNAYIEIKKDPVVEDFEIHQFNETIICTVILKSDAHLEDYAYKASQIKMTIQKVFKDSKIIVGFKQKSEEASFY